MSDRIPDWFQDVPRWTDEHHKGPLSILTVYHEVLYIQLCMLTSKSANCSCYIAGCLAEMWSSYFKMSFLDLHAAHGTTTRKRFSSSKC